MNQPGGDPLGWFILGLMDDWELFDDPRFELALKYPRHTKNAERVERVETQQEGILRAHMLAPKSREVYFEITKFDSLTAEAEFQRHKEFLPEQFDTVVISELQVTAHESLPAYEYSFEWDQGKRVVILVERGRGNLPHPIRPALSSKSTNLIHARMAQALNFPHSP